MSDELLIKCGSPTLAGLKTGNMFSYAYESREEVKRDLRRLNKILVPRGLRVLPLRYNEKTVLLYLYRIDALRKDLSGHEAAKILHEVGYESADSDRCVVELITKLRSAKEFPHEVGLFLSYPPEDVRGFIDNHAENCKYLGFWKVYGDVEQATQRQWPTQWQTAFSPKAQKLSCWAPLISRKIWSQNMTRSHSAAPLWALSSLRKLSTSRCGTM